LGLIEIWWKALAKGFFEGKKGMERCKSGESGLSGKEDLRRVTFPRNHEGVCRGMQGAALAQDIEERELTKEKGDIESLRGTKRMLNI